MDDTKTEDTVAVTSEELHAEAQDLSHKLGLLFNGHTKNAIAAAMWGIIACDRDIAQLIGRFSLNRFVDKMKQAGPCDDPTCAACVAKKAKVAQA